MNTHLSHPNFQSFITTGRYTSHPKFVTTKKAADSYTWWLHYSLECFLQIPLPKFLVHHSSYFLSPVFLKKFHNCSPKMMIRYISGVLIVLCVLMSSVVDSRLMVDNLIRWPSDHPSIFESDDDSVGTRWAVLIAGSSGYWNYRHQVIFMFT